MKLFQSFSFFLNTKSQQKRKRTNKKTEKDFGRKNKFHNLLSFFPKDLFPKLL